MVIILSNIANYLLLFLLYLFFHFLALVLNVHVLDQERMSRVG